MEIEKQVCSFELAKRLKELGAKQESLFYWLSDATTKDELRVIAGDDFRAKSPACVCAFTVAEFGEMLRVAHCAFRSGNIWDKHQWECSYGVSKTTLATTEADARAAMLIYLFENKLIAAAA
jgi:hypothetical protein